MEAKQYAPSIVKVGDVKGYVTTKKTKTGRTSETAVFYTYRDVEYDIDGWADSKLYLPADFDLIYMRLLREKTIPGWISGRVWNGARLRSDDRVLFWKRKMEDADL